MGLTWKGITLFLRPAWIGLAASLALAGLALAAVPAEATIRGNCTGSGYATPDKPKSVADAGKAAGASNTVDFKSSEWRVRSYHYYLAGEGKADGAMSSGEAFVDVFGQRIRVAGGSGSGVSGTGGPLSIADILPEPLKDTPPAARISASGSAVPDPRGNPPASGPCSGEIDIIFEDVTAAGSIAGGAGIGLGVVGIIGVLATALRRVSG